jgi:hypothetical protein
MAIGLAQRNAGQALAKKKKNYVRVYNALNMIISSYDINDSFNYVTAISG